MRVGILGSGLMGGKLGTIFARAGHEVIFSYARGKDKLKKLASGAQGNARAGTPGEAAKEADAVLLAEGRWGQGRFSLPHRAQRSAVRRIRREAAVNATESGVLR